MCLFITDLLINEEDVYMRDKLRRIALLFEKSDENKEFRALSTVIWSISVVAYFLVSLFTGAWYITWVIFLIGTAIISIIKAVFELRR